MARWELIAKDVRFVRCQPPADFFADMYRCSNCHNRVNNNEGLPMVCPWCREEMEGGEAEK